jgi:PPOX class probable F420-dependent enzyme
MALDPANLPDDVLAFLTDRHLATLTTLRPDGSPHVAPVGFTYDAGARLVRIITFAGAQRVRNLSAAPASRAVVCQVDGARWLALEGPAEVTDDPARVAVAVDAYASRYRTPGERDDRRAVEIRVDRILGRA